MAAVLLLPLLVLFPPAASSVQSPHSVPFRAGLLFAQSSASGGDWEDQNGAPLGGCLDRIADAVEQSTGDQQVDLGGNLLEQLLADGRLKMAAVCRAFTAQSDSLRECLRREEAALPPVLPLLQSVCVQFAEVLDRHSGCLSELGLSRLEAQCAEACQRRSLRAGNASSPSSGSESLCELCLCTSKCTGAQMSECPGEIESDQQRAAAEGNELRRMAEQLDGLQMLLALRRGVRSQAAVQSLLQSGAVPPRCARLVGTAGNGANFVSGHDLAPQRLSADNGGQPQEENLSVE